MAAKREDCVLVTDDDDRIAGIFTAKDLAFRVVGAGVKASNVMISEIMTKNPLCARTDTSATDALDLMVRKGFRHLPVMDENQDISGILDITKCFYDAMEKLERAYSSSRKLYDALEGVQSELGSSQPQQIIQYVEALRSKMSGPTLESVLDGRPPVTVTVRTSVKEAAAAMKEHHTTAVLVQDQGSITGIFTSKDVVLRVIAPGLDPANCSVVRVMTPHPDFAPMDMSIQAALRKMHDGHYLNLPVMNEGGEIVGMVDVLKLTYATLEQINTMSTGDSEGPAWNKFWLSLDNETESVMSGEGSHHHTAGRSLMSPDMSRGHERIVDASVAPGDSASHVGGDSPAHSAVSRPADTPAEEVPFPFKFKAPSGRVHRLQVIAKNGMAELITSVIAKLGSEVEAVGGAATFEDGKLGASGFALSYLDDEGDTVSITTDQDLLEAVLIARHGRREKVDLFVHDPEKPPISTTVDHQPVITQNPTPPPTASTVRERRRVVSDEDDESEDEAPVRPRSRKAAAKPAEKEVIAGVPNELLLPGAIVTLAVVIVGVFAITRATSHN
jgi:CBS domain-containing protein